LNRTIWTDEWSILAPDQQPVLRGMTLSAAGAEQAERWTKSRLLEVQELRGGLRIATRSYVGTVRLNDLTLHIRPKIGPETLPVFMRYALELPAVSRQGPALTPTVGGGFLDLLGLLFLEELDLVLRSGMFQDYRPAEAWLTSPRGQLRFTELARQPYRTALGLPCRYAQRTPDLVLNQLLGAAARVLSTAVTDRRLQFELHARESMLAEQCQRVPLSLALLDDSRAALDRRSAYYEPAVRLAELVLSGKGPAFEDGERAPLPGFLFNMDLLFERFVARLCREFAPPGVRVEAQEQSAAAYRYRLNPDGWALPRLRPDLVIRTAAGAPQLVLDTKYKLLAGRPPSPADLYQLTLYSLSFGRGAAVPARLLYPTLRSGAEEPQLDFYGFQQAGPLASVSLLGLNLGNCASALRTRDAGTLRKLVGEWVTPLSLTPTA